MTLELEVQIEVKRRAVIGAEFHRSCVIIITLSVGVGGEGSSLEHESLEDLGRNADLYVFNDDVAQNQFLKLIR